MPRDLSQYSAAANQRTLEGMSDLDRSPKNDPPPRDRDGDDVDGDADDARSDHTEYEDDHDDDDDQRNEERDRLHPYVQTLSISDIESCIRLEDVAFPPQERCSREKFQYRLKHCGELSLGIFTSEENSTVATAATSAPVFSGAPQRKSILLGHIVSTKTTNPVVTDDDMAIPSPSSSSSSSSSSSTSTSSPPSGGTILGHREEGRTICLHSLAVLPEYQRRGLGTTLMKAYLHRLETHDVADRVALISHEPLIPYYEALGFVNQGPSRAQFGGGGWYDMVKVLQSEDAWVDAD